MNFTVSTVHSLKMKETKRFKKNPCILPENKKKKKFSNMKWVTIILIGTFYKGPGSNTPQDTNCTATCPLSRKLFKLGEPDMQDTAGEAEMNS